MLNKTKTIMTIVLVGFMTSGIVRAETKQLSPKRILAIFAFKQALPWSYLIEEGLRTTLDSGSAFPIELNVEYADQSRFPEKAYMRKIVDLYRYKYANRKIDLVLALGDESIALLLEYGGQLFGDIPVLLVTSNITTIPDDLLKPNMITLSWGLDMESTLGYIRVFLPQTRHLFVISGTSITDRAVRDVAVATLGKFEAEWKVQHLTDLPAAELLEKVARLPEDSAIYYLTVFRDGKGEYFVPRNLMSEIAHRANAPVFGLVDTYLGHGTVGGSLVSAKNRGKRIAKVAVKILTGEALDGQDLMGKDSSPMFDWRQLKRWSIDQNKLPPGSIVQYRKRSIWVDHKGKIIGVIAIILAQAFVLVYLLNQRKKRGRAERESQRLRDELAHVSRVLSMGELAASLAHEINQPLAAIQSYAQGARRYIAGDRPTMDEVDEFLVGIVAGNRRAKEVIQRIRMALKKESVERSLLHVKDLIHETIILVRKAADEKRILLSLDIDPKLPPVLGDRTQLQQVFLNLIINSFEAMGDGKNGSHKLTVRASKEAPDDVMVSVEDNGIGIGENNKEQLFNSFFTTKAEGLGMGLSISRSIIEDHGGRLWATRNPDHGTTFFFTVPICDEDSK